LKTAIAAFVRWLSRWLIRVVLLLAALVFFFCLLTVATMLLAVWLVRALWARLTGKPVAPWVFRVDPRAHWSGFGQAPERAPATQRDDRDVIDVIPREIKAAQKPADRVTRGSESA
jgi:hypothetical protein